MLTNCILIFLISVSSVIFSTRKIIFISHAKRLFDEPTEARKIHKQHIPNLGGVPIFACIFFVLSIFLPEGAIPKLNFLSAAAFILFFLGLTDDLVGIRAIKKILVQVFVSVIIVMLGDYRISNFHGFFGIYEIGFFPSVLFSILFILTITNAFNLIDGINCLAGSIGLLVGLVYSFYFYRMHDIGFLYLSIALSSCLVGFLYYNRTPAKVFMGDTGALMQGLIIAILSIRLLELSKAGFQYPPHTQIINMPQIILSLLLVPTFDCIRVFMIRIWNRKSPISADRNHIHHRLVDLGYSHIKATLILVSITIVAFLFELIGGNWRMEWGFSSLIIYALSLNFILGRLHKRKMKHSAPIKNLSKIEEEQRVQSRIRNSATIFQ